MYGFIHDIIEEKGSSVHTTAPGASVADAVRAMNDKGVGALLVEQDGKPVGIFTERDVLRRIVDAGLDPVSTTVDDVMTSDLVTVTPGTSVEEAMQVMGERRLRHLPVIEGSALAGIVSIVDLMRRVSSHQASEIQQLTDYITGPRPSSQ